MPLDKKNAIGWDIGIKNLAYCVLEHSTNTSTNPQTTNHSSSNHTAPNHTAPNHITFNNTAYQITNWADISLLSQITNNLADAGEATSFATKLTCACPKNDKINAPICGAAASYCHESLAPSGEYRGYCKSHFKKSSITRMPTIPVSKCYHPGCSSRASLVLKEHVFMGYCKKHVSELTKAGGTRVEADFLKINNVKNAGKIDINQLGMALFQELDKIKAIITNPDVILLENQPVLKNPTMKSMQMFLYSYYLMRILEGNKSNGISGLGEKYIQCYTASKKLDLIKFFPVGEQSRISGLLSKVRNGYARNKKMSILMVEYLLKDNVKWLQFFKGHPKQDDLADSLLMTLHYFERDNLAKLNKASKKAALKAGVKTGDASVIDKSDEDDILEDSLNLNLNLNLKNKN